MNGRTARARVRRAVPVLHVHLQRLCVPAPARPWPRGSSSYGQTVGAAAFLRRRSPTPPTANRPVPIRASVAGSGVAVTGPPAENVVAEQRSRAVTEAPVSHSVTAYW